MFHITFQIKVTLEHLDLDPEIHINAVKAETLDGITKAVLWIRIRIFWSSWIRIR